MDDDSTKRDAAQPIIWHRNEDQLVGTKHGKHSGKYGATLAGTRGATSTSGFHHVAMVCKNMKETITFYENAMGMKLRAIYPMHGALSRSLVVLPACAPARPPS